MVGSRQKQHFLPTDLLSTAFYLTTEISRVVVL